MNILIVDDEPLAVQSLRLEAGKAGFEETAAHPGAVSGMRSG